MGRGANALFIVLCYHDSLCYLGGNLLLWEWVFTWRRHGMERPSALPEEPVTGEYSINRVVMEIYDVFYF